MNQQINGVANENGQGNAESDPIHIAIIMDGNNRWAKQRNLDTISGHKAGADQLKELMEGFELYPQLKYLTVFAFSSENWSRPKKEVGALMSLFYSMLKINRKMFLRKNIRLRVIGNRDKFSIRLNKLIDVVENDTKDGHYTLAVAADYGGRWDIVNSAKQLAQQVALGHLKPEEISEEHFTQYLATDGMPDPDLLIRTGAEQRISNFMLWQTAYTELYFADCYWPDFDVQWLNKAITVYYERDRRYGGAGDGDEYQAITQSTFKENGATENVVDLKTIPNHVERKKVISNFSWSQ